MTDQSKTIDTLNELIETCKDGEYGFRACSEQAKSHELKSMLASRASECRSAAQQLQALVLRMGGKAEDDGSMLGAMHRGWVSVKAKMSSYDDLAVLEECERGEDAALETYREAMKEDLTPEARTLVDQQYQGVKRNHDEVRRRRDELKVKA